MSVVLSVIQPEKNSIQQWSGNILLPCWTLMLLIGSHSWAQDVPQYRFQRNIEIGELQQDELIAFALDTPVYANTQDSLNDLRIEDTEGTTVPFIVRRKHNPETYNAEKAWFVEDVAFQPVKESGLEIRFELDADDPVPDGLRILTPLKNFEQRVNLFAIDETEQKTLLVEDEIIFDYSQFMDVRSVEIQLPETNARSFQLEIDALTTHQRSQLTELTRKLTGDEEVSQQLRTSIVQRPFRIDRIELWAEFQEARSKVLDTYPYDLMSVESEVKRETNETVINIKSLSQPLTQFEIVTSEQNFQRNATLYEVSSAGLQDTLRLVTETKLVQLNFRDIQKDELTFRFPRNRHAQFQIIIDNGDNPALNVVDIIPSGQVDEVVFVAKKATSYVLQYGNQHLDKPNFDSDTIQALLNEDVEPITASLSRNETVLIADSNAHLTLRDAMNNPIFIGLIVLVLIIILVWLLYSAAQKVDQIPEELSD